MATVPSDIPTVGEEELREKYPFTRRSNIKVYAIKGNKFEIPEKYVVTARLGQGSYGMVVQATDTEHGSASKRQASSRTSNFCDLVFMWPGKIWHWFLGASFVSERAFPDSVLFKNPRFRMLFLS